MNISSYTNYLLIAIGCFVAVYAQSGVEQNTVVLVLGIVILMFGIYRIARNIPSKFDKNDHEDINEEDENI